MVKSQLEPSYSHRTVVAPLSHNLTWARRSAYSQIRGGHWVGCSHLSLSRSFLRTCHVKVQFWGMRVKQPTIPTELLGSWSLHFRESWKVFPTLTLSTSWFFVNPTCRSIYSSSPASFMITHSDYDYPRPSIWDNYHLCSITLPFNSCI